MAFIWYLIAFAALAIGPAHADVTEDSPEWNCATMGNSICGPGVVPPTWPAYCDDRRDYSGGPTTWIDTRTGELCREER